MPDETIPQLLAEAEADISRVTGLTQATRDEVSAVREALTLLRTSSSANFPETIVFRVVQQLESAIVGIESKAAGYEQETLSILRRIARRERPSATATPITISFTENTAMALPPVAGNTLVYTGTLSPAGSAFPAGTTFTAVSSDPTVAPTVDPTGLIVTIPLPETFVDDPANPFNVVYTASGITPSPASSPTSITATITPSVPTATPTGISFTQTT